MYIGGTLPVAPIGEETRTFCTFSNFTDFFIFLQHHYVGARWLSAPIQYIGALNREAKC
jgi:hypothetical protein